jgi:IrrE N-terminal-like domain
MMAVFPRIPATDRLSWRALRKTGHGLRPATLATRVLRDLNVSRPPVDVVSIARTLGAEVYLAPNLGGVLGALDSTGEVPTIWLNKSDSGKRQRFTTAHELGHLLMHPLGRLLRDESYATANKPEEADANEFAAHLLMPLWLLEPYVTGSQRSTEQLAQLFDVSLPAMKWQLAKLI